jgi:hypothetical protein
MTASYRRAAYDVGEGTDFRLVSLGILPGHTGTKLPSLPRPQLSHWGRFFWADDFKRTGALLAELCHSQIQNRLNDAAKLNECLATTH